MNEKTQETGKRPKYRIICSDTTGVNLQRCEQQINELAGQYEVVSTVILPYPDGVAPDIVYTLRLIHPALTAVLESGSSDLAARVEALEKRLNDEVPSPVGLSRLFNRVDALEKRQRALSLANDVREREIATLGKSLGDMGIRVGERLNALEAGARPVPAGCERCDGSGYVDALPPEDSSGLAIYKRNCPVCDGSGRREAHE